MKKWGCEFERKKGKVKGRVWKEREELGNDVILIVTSKNKMHNF